MKYNKNQMLAIFDFVGIEDDLSCKHKFKRTIEQGADMRSTWEEDHIICEKCGLDLSCNGGMWSLTYEYLFMGAKNPFCRVRRSSYR